MNLLLSIYLLSQKDVCYNIHLDSIVFISAILYNLVNEFVKQHFLSEAIILLDIVNRISYFYQKF